MQDALWQDQRQLSNRSDTRFNKSKTLAQRKARGSERYGIIVVSSQAQRLKPFCHWCPAFPYESSELVLGRKGRCSIFILSRRCSHWISCPKPWVRIIPVLPGMEIWDFQMKVGKRLPSKAINGKTSITKIEKISHQCISFFHQSAAKMYGYSYPGRKSPEDHTRKSEFYDSTYNYLKGIGVSVL